MRKVIVVMLMLMMSMMLGACTRIEPGWAGIKVNYMGSQKGVEDFPVQTGLIWYIPGITGVKEYPTFVQTASWAHLKHEGRSTDDSIAFNDKNGMQVTMDISLSYEIEMTKVPQFYVKFRTDDLGNFTYGFLRNVGRDAFTELGSRYSIDDLFGHKKEELLSEVRKRINEEMKPFGVHLVQFGLLGNIGVPPEIKKSIDAKQQAIQDAIRTQNEVAQSRAQAEKDVAKAEGDSKSRIARARGEYESNKLINQSITNQMIEWERLKIQRELISKWDGKYPTTYFSGNNTPNMLMQMPSGK